MKPKFADLELDFWVHQAKLGATQPSLCLFHGSQELGSPILDACQELQTETGPAQRKLSFVTCRGSRALSSLRLLVTAEREELRVLNIRCDAESATIEMTAQGLALVIDAITSWLSGAEDFGVSPRHAPISSQALGKFDQESGELWFWGPGYTGP